MKSQALDDRALVQALASQIRETVPRTGPAIQIMEVCGTHTHVVSAAGLRRLVAPQIRLISGPGCPVCVTPMTYLDHAQALAARPDVIVCTFGDLFRVPSSHGSLETTSAQTGRVKAVYCPRDALAIAKAQPDKVVVFLAIGFETTAPTIAAVLQEAETLGISNFRILPGNKVVAPALRALLTDASVEVHGFLLPGHVSAITGANAFDFLHLDFGLPGAVAGFSAPDVLAAVLEIVKQRANKRPTVTNLYRQVVSPEGNKTAQQLMHTFFEPIDAVWRGLGLVPGSGLALRRAWRHRDATSIPVEYMESEEPAGCRCGDVLKGSIEPPDCGLFGTACTPDHAIGACMVSGEGTCAAWYRHER